MDQYDTAGFVKIRRLGKGAFGEALLYKRLADDALVVLKSFDLESCGSGNDGMQRRRMAIKESETLRLLSHHNIIMYMDAFEDNGTLLIEMEYADGGTLRDKVDKQCTLGTGFSEEQVKWYGYQLASGLEHIHAHSIIHRDIKSENVFLTRFDVVKIGDFGVSKVLAGSENFAKTVAGTPYYMAPEMLMGQTYNSKADVFSMGCILHELCTLKRTYQATNIVTVVTKIVDGKRSAINNAAFTEDLIRSIDSCLSPESGDRPSCNELLESNVLGPTTEQHNNVLQAYRMSSSANPSRISSSVTQRSSSRTTSVTSSNSVGDTASPMNSGSTSKFLTKETRMFTFGAGGAPKINAEFLPKTAVAPVRISGGGAHFAVVTVEKKLYTWNAASPGDLDGHSYGQLGHGDFASVRNPKSVEATKDLNVVDVSCGDDFTICLDAVGQLYSWGCNENGCLGTGEDDEDRCIPASIVFEDASSHSRSSIPGFISNGLQIVQIACGVNHVLCVTSSGTAFSWGNGEMGKLGLGDEDDRFTPNPITFSVGPGLSPIIASVAAGYDGSLFLTDSGQIYGSGNNDHNQLGINKSGCLLDFKRKVATLSGNLIEEGQTDGQVNACCTPLPAYSFRTGAAKRYFTQVSIGATHSAAIDDRGAMYIFGDNKDGQLGTGNTSKVDGVYKVKLEINGQLIERVACGDGYTIACTDNGTILSWGKAVDRTLGFETDKIKVCRPRKIGFDFLSDKISDICCSAGRTILISEKIVAQQDMSHIDLETESASGESDVSVGMTRNLSANLSTMSDDLPSWLAAELEDIASDKINLPAVGDEAIVDKVKQPLSDDCSYELEITSNNGKSDNPLEHVNNSNPMGENSDEGNGELSDEDDIPTWLAAELAETPIPIPPTQKIQSPSTITAEGNCAQQGDVVRVFVPSCETRHERIIQLKAANEKARVLLGRNGTLGSGRIADCENASQRVCIPTEVSQLERIERLKQANRFLKTSS